mgnify:CR=1 FL=1
MAKHLSIDLRDSARLCIDEAVRALVQFSSEYQVISEKIGSCSLAVRVASSNTFVDFVWDVRDKHHIRVGPRESIEHRIRCYGIHQLVMYGGGVKMFMLQRSNPKQGVEELVERVPEILNGDWSKESELSAL